MRALDRSPRPWAPVALSGKIGAFSGLGPCYDRRKGGRTMRMLSNDVGRIELRELIDAVREEPVTVLERGEPVAVVLSPAEFDRLDEQDRIRREAKARLRRTISSIQQEAAERGLTDAELERLMADES